jgi:hypothetical protein
MFVSRRKNRVFEERVEEFTRIGIVGKSDDVGIHDVE